MILLKGIIFKIIYLAKGLILTWKKLIIIARIKKVIKLIKYLEHLKQEILELKEMLKKLKIIVLKKKKII